jgi:putative ATP-dependent endonuclease of the OLD family
MGQSIVTSHSPYVIEQFEPQQIVILDRDDAGKLMGHPISIQYVKPKTYKTARKQFAEAILSRAVLVVEGSTEGAMFSVASTVMEESLGSAAYTHFDLAGVSIFAASGDGDVPRHGPIFAALGKQAFGFYDKPKTPMTPEALAKLASYTKHWESSDTAVEELLAKETSIPVLKRFFAEVTARGDYPKVDGVYDAAASDPAIRALAVKVLKARKGEAHGYAAILIEQCQNADELPKTIRMILEEIDKSMKDTPPAKAGEIAQAGLFDGNSAL